MDNLNYADEDKEEEKIPPAPPYKGEVNVENIGEENKKNETIEDEWTPDIEELKKEAKVDEDNENESRGILDDLIRGN